MRNVVIIGSGPAGYTAGIYTQRANLNPLIISGDMKGGQLTNTPEIENFPGFPGGIGGVDLMNLMEKHVTELGCEIKNGLVVKLERNPDKSISVFLRDGEVIQTKTIIIATGSTPKKLGVENEDEAWLTGGISTCATCDGFFYRNKEVCVIGAGDTAFEEAIYLSKICSKVTLFARTEKFKASQILVDRAKSIENIEIIVNTSVVKFKEDDGLKKVFITETKNKIINDKGVEVSNLIHTTHSFDGVFIAVGSNPNTSFIDPNFIPLDENGYIMTEDNSTATYSSGVFACGDVADPVFKQAIVSAGAGSMSAIECERFLNHN